METVMFLVNSLKVVVGLGFVIFLHELGHFLVAKWCGVYVKSFSIGFPPNIWSIKRGETEYVIGATPLGGYVNMLGENPEEDGKVIEDPRAFRNKPVGARIAILSAGVVMNLILGIACFTSAYLLGVEELPAKVGYVQAGSPAYEAGLRAGDEVVAIDGRGNINFSNLRAKVSLSAAGQALTFDVNRPGLSQPLRFDIEPRRQANAEAPSIGVGFYSGLELMPGVPYETSIGVANPPKEPFAGLKGGDKVVAAGLEGRNPEQVDDYSKLQQILTKYRDKPVDVFIERKGENPTDTPTREMRTLPPNQFVDFGFRLTPGPVASLQAGFPAEKAGIQKGDVIVKVDGKSDFDPMRLPDYFFEHAGKAVAVTVRRGEGPSAKETELSVVPDDSAPWLKPAVEGENMLEIPGIGLGFVVQTQVAAVSDGSPAALAGIKPGDVIRSFSVTLPPSKPGTPSKSVEFRLDGGKDAWPLVFSQMQLLPKSGFKISLTLNNDPKPVEIAPIPRDGWFNPMRGLNFQLLIREIPPQPWAVALSRGTQDSVDSVMSIYSMIRSLFQSRVSTKNLAGIPRIAGMAYQSADAGFVQLLMFLGMLSINLAVLNFLPIPPLDGGQIVIHLGEKIRGKPLPRIAENVGMIGGLTIVLGLILYTNIQDIVILIRGYFS